MAAKHGTSVDKKNPTGDPVDAWLHGATPPPALSEKLAVAQEIPVPSHTKTHQYGDDLPDDEPDAGGEEEPAAPVVPELAGVDPLGFLPELPAVQVCSNLHESPPGAKFCMECGEPFRVQAEIPVEALREWTCAGGHLIAGDAKFCMECGDQRPDLKAVAPVAGAGVAAELAARPTPYEMLSPQERAQRDALHAAAVREGSRDVPLQFERPPEGVPGTTTIYVEKSGWTFAGNVWMRGQEITLVPGTARWQEAQRWIHWTDEEQFQNYGCIRWRRGRWPGRRSYMDIEPGSYQRLGGLSGGEVAGPTKEQLLQADAAEAARAGGVPAPLYR